MPSIHFRAARFLIDRLFDILNAQLMENGVLKLIMALTFALLLLPGFASAEERCHSGKAAMDGEAAIASGHDAAHEHHPADGIEEVPQTVPVSAEAGLGAKGDCPRHPGIVHTCSTQIALTKCGMHGCCIKSDVPLADDSFSPKVAPEMAIDADGGFNPHSLTGIATPYLLKKLSNLYPPNPRPPSA